MHLSIKPQSVVLMSVLFLLALCSIRIEAATINGYVTAQDTGAAVSDIYVFVLDKTERTSWGSAITTATGYYEFNEVPAGTYIMEANTLNDGYYIPEVYENTTCLYDDCDKYEVGTSVVVSAEEIRSINFELERKAVIFGRITDAQTGLPIVGMALEFEDPSISASYVSYWFNEVTDSNGQFRAEKVIPGNYFLELDGYWSNSNGSDYPKMVYPDFYCDTSPCYPGEQGTTIKIDVGDDIEFDLGLKKGGVINGSVVDSRTGLALEDLASYFTQVTLNKAFVPSPYENVYLGDNSEFQFTALTPGDYYIFVDLEHYDPVSFIPQWYLDSFEEDQAIPISVDFYSEIDVSMSLESLAIISGRVIDEETQAGIHNSEIIFTLMSDLRQKTATTTDENGYFETELLAGKYQVQAGILFDGHEPETYIPEMLGNIYCTSFDCSNDLSIGTPLVVENSTTIENLDFALSKTASIRGQVTDENTGNLIDIVSVDANEITFNYGYNDNYTDGNYQIDGLLPGTYKVHTTFHRDYIGEYYDGLQILDAPASFTPLTVEAATQYNIDFALEPKPFVTGKVTDEQTGEPLFNVLVKLIDLDNKSIIGSITEADGSYTIHHIAGSYKLIFDRTNFVPELYNNLGCSSYEFQIEPDSCLDDSNFTVVELVTGLPARADAQLSKGSIISGTVTDEETGLPLADINYRLFHETGREIGYHSDYTYENGQFSIRLIPPGKYYLKINAGNESGYVDELYDGVPCVGPRQDCESAATALVFTDPAEVDVEISLKKGLSISGTVTSQQTGLALTNVAVDVYSSDWRSRPGTSYLLPDGTYSINGLVPGEYYLVFYPWGADSGYSQQIHDSIICPAWACDYRSLATFVTLEEGQHLIIDAQLIEKIIFENGFE